MDENLQMTQAVAEKLANLPTSPGVYLMKDASGEIIYVGKAVVLKNRVRQYFQNQKNHPPKVRAMVAHIADLETIVTKSENEALILENNLIKKYQPHYNIDLKDDKTYPYVKVTLGDEFPRIVLTRRIIDDNAKYFGAYADVGALHRSLKLLRQIFPLRRCRKFTEGRACLYYHIKRCCAPCIGAVSKEEYDEMVKSVLLFLDGKTKKIEENLERQIKIAAEKLAFEKAAKYRDQLLAIRSAAPVSLDTEKILRERSKAAKNMPQKQLKENAAEELAQALNLKTVPQRIECFDISHIQGTDTVASLVVFTDGKPDKKEYRHYKLKTTEGKSDDLASMKEVLTRRYAKRPLNNPPDLVVIDGGPAQLRAALEIIHAAGCNFPVISLAKRFELVYCDPDAEPVELERRSQSLYLVEKIRDESHRFAIAYHRKLRKKRNLSSLLDGAAQIGAKRRQAIYQYFGTLDKIKTASLEELASVPTMNKAAAKELFDYLRH